MGRFSRVALGLSLALGASPLVAASAGSAWAGDDPDTEYARRLFNAGAAQYAAGHYAQAVIAFQKAKLAKPVPAFDFNIARCYDRLGRWAEALGAYERFAATTSDPGELAEANGRISVLRKRLEDAAGRAASEEHYRGAIERYNAGDYPGAVREFELAYRAQPDPMHLYNAAQAYRLAGDGRHALADYQRFVEEAPASPMRGAVDLRIAELKASQRAGDPSLPPPGARAEPAAPHETIAPGSAVAASAASPGSADLDARAKSTSERLVPLAELIKSHRAGFRSCYDEWSRTHPGIPGKVSLSFYLDPDGVLNQVAAETKGFDAPGVAACIVDFARTLQYPPAPNARYTRFTYPFDFKPSS